MVPQGFFCVFSGVNLAPFPIEFRMKKIPMIKKKEDFFLKIGVFIQSEHTQATW